MDKQPERKWDDAALAGDAVTKKMIAEFLIANGSSDFLEQNGIKFSKVELVAKTYSKDVLIGAYKGLFAAGAFRNAAVEEAKKAAMEQQKKEEADTAKANADADIPAASEVKAEKPLFRKEVLKKVPLVRLLLLTGQGTGATPQKGDNVSVRYKGTLTDGKVFDTNMEKKAPALQFKVGVGKVIKALLEMKVGEQCRLTIEPEGAYGKKGVEGKIPPNSTLIFEVELLNVS